ncbi:pyruvate kinase [Heliorestis acidaminivorans]|uniref:Pyruvate kinase n=1 Tax=Heliorestis acidaminivorans TaxID=553427 RepID=A0A6I0ER38_9FIRM|nr:pyruvate kinase [Heliorestis acidaminivorans]KAB2950759.1 pyruvate kinase [Heliorestis acidaminivorans]
MQKKTKVVCTVGPSTDPTGVLDKMIEAGMNVARFNFSHGTHEEHGRRIALVREAAKRAGKPIALMLDTKGPEMRIRSFADNKVQLTAGQSFVLTSREIVGTAEKVSVNYQNLPQEVMVGARILLADGLISLVVEQIEGPDIYTIVQNSGVISNNKRVAVPGVLINLPPLSVQDIADIQFGIALDMDCIAASFIQRASDILAIRKVLEDAGAHMALIAKIESPIGVDNIDEILHVADGIMVARGDLGIEIPAEDVPMVQKMLIQKCNNVGKPVITATQMLESMMVNPRPTRAEASDVANAIMDGTDAVMLSGETAMGQYPVEAVETMARIAQRTERDLPYENWLLQKSVKAKHIQVTTTDAISHATVQMAHELDASAIVTATYSGHTARMVSKYRPQAPIVALTPSKKTTRFLQLSWGVYPLLTKQFNNSDDIVNDGMKIAQDSGFIQGGDLVVITAGMPFGTPGTTNMIRVHLVAKIMLKGQGIGQQAAQGKVCLVRKHQDLHKFQPGDIMVVAGIDETTAPYASQAAAIVAEESGLSSNAVIVGINCNIPVVVSATDALKLLRDGMVVTVDALRGFVYEGDIQVR